MKFSCIIISIRHILIENHCVSAIKRFRILEVDGEKIRVNMSDAMSGRTLMFVGEGAQY